MPASASELQPDEKHQIDSARGAILGVYLLALLVCLGRVSEAPGCGHLRPRTSARFN